MTKLFKSLALLSLLVTSSAHASAEALPMLGVDAVAAPATVFESEDLAGISGELDALLPDIQTLVGNLSGNIADIGQFSILLDSFQKFAMPLGDKIRGKDIEGLSAEEQISVTVNIEHDPIAIPVAGGVFPINLFSDIAEQAKTFSRARFIAYKNKVRDIVNDVNTVEYSVEPIAGYIPTQTLASLVERFQSPENLGKLAALSAGFDDDVETLVGYSEPFKITSFILYRKLFSIIESIAGDIDIHATVTSSDAALTEVFHTKLSKMSQILTSQ